jgi:transglutaminase-like putative cysteine protease
MDKYIKTILFVILVLCRIPFVAYGSEGTEDILAECAEFENGKEVTFDSNADWIRFANFYMNNYDMNDCQIHYESDGYSIRILDEGKYDRAQVVQEILDTFAPVTGNTAEEKIFNTCRMVSDTINYNEDYTYATLDSSIKDKQGVCWQYAKISAVLLRENGIPCDVVYGYVGKNIQSHETTHMWLKCYTGTKTIFADPGRGILTDEYYRSNYQEISLKDWAQMVSG